jgi:phage terminase large subunit-like protein
LSKFVQLAQQYVSDVLTGTVPACNWVRRACQRSQKDRERIGQPDFPFVFDEKKASRVCDFISHLRHVEGPHAGERIRLESWQCWVLAEVFGWQWADTNTRRYARAYVEIPRGNGKTTLASGVSLFCAFAEGEAGADCICAATSLAQSRRCLDMARVIVENNELLREKLGLRVDANQIRQMRSNSRFRVVSSKPQSAEGMATHLGVIDELHLHKSRNLHDAISTGCGKRPQSLLWLITTAGYDKAGICFEQHDFAERLLEGLAQDETSFAVIYTCDPDDDPFDEATLCKANPNWGVSVDTRYVLGEMRRAKQCPAQRDSYRMRFLCQWTGNDGTESFLDFHSIQKCYDATLREEDFAGQPAVLAADFASKCDLCSAVKVHAKSVDNKPHLFVFTKNWLPEEALRNNPTASLHGWVERGELLTTPGAVVDFDSVEESLMQWFGTCTVKSFNYDPMQSTMLVTHLKRRSEQWDCFVEISQFAKNMSDGMNLLAEMVADGRLHTNSQILLWCLSNLKHRHVGLHFIAPIRPQDRNRKIDCAVALIMACKSVPTLLDKAEDQNPRIIVLDPFYKWKCGHEGCDELTNHGDYCDAHYALYPETTRVSNDRRVS